MRGYDVTFIGRLCCRFPEFIPLLQEHRNTYGVLLPHVLMGDITRWVIQRFHADASDVTLRDVLDFIEEAFDGANAEVRELIAASFLENLPRPGQSDAGVRALLGPALVQQLRQIG